MKKGATTFEILTWTIAIIFGFALLYWVSGDLKDIMVGLFDKLTK